MRNGVNISIDKMARICYTVAKITEGASVMVAVHDNQSDVNDNMVTVRIICPECCKSETATLPTESLAYMTRNQDGSYMDEIGCAECES